MPKLPAEHPFIAAVFDSWCRSRGLEPTAIRRMCTGEDQASRKLAEAALAELDVPLSAWPRLEPDYNLSGGASARHRPAAVTKPSTIAQGNGGGVARGMHARSGHPFLAWLDDRTVAEWAAAHGLTRAKVQSWVTPGKGHRNPSQADREMIARESNGAVPADCWDR